jgi:hypothetical protein
MVGKQEALPVVTSGEPHVSVLLESRDTGEPRTSQVIEYEEQDCDRVHAIGRIPNGPRVTATAWYGSDKVELIVVFDEFPEDTRQFLYELFGHPYDAALDPLTLTNHRLVASTAKTRLITSYAKVKILPGINVVLDAEVPAGLRALIDVDTQGKRLSFFGLLPLDDRETVNLFSAPLFKLVSDSLTLRRTFIRIDAGLRRAHEEDGGYRRVRCTLRGTIDVGDTPLTIHGPLVRDHELVLMRLLRSDAIDATLADFDLCMGGNSAWRDTLSARLRVGNGVVRLLEYTRHIAQGSGKVVSVHAAFRLPGGVVTWEQARLQFSQLDLSFTVGFPHEADAQVHVSATGVATVVSARANVGVPDLRITFQIAPTCEWTIGLMMQADRLPRFCEIFDVLPSVMGESQTDLVWCHLRLPHRGSSVLEVWPQEDDA